MTERTSEFRKPLLGVAELRNREATRVGKLFMKHQHNDPFLRTGRPL